jgi:hypothetical protein
MNVRRRSLVLGAMLVAAVVAASVAAGGPAAPKQRIAMEGTFDTNTGRSTWVLIPLTKGPLVRDSGTGSGTGDVKKTIVRNGQSVTPITGSDILNGKRGAIAVTQKVESRSAGHGYNADVGTWTFTGQLDDYEGFKGGGGFAAVGLPNGKLFIRSEGWVSKR